MKSLLLILTIIVFHQTSFADDVYTVIVKKQAEKKAKRWTLQEWMQTKAKIGLMDSWLAANSSPFETIIEGAYAWASNDNGNLGDINGYHASFTAFASLVGVKAEYEKIFTEKISMSFHFRLLGFYEQGTNLTLEGGLRQYDGGQNARNIFAGAHSNIYLSPFFGIEGVYRHYFESQNTTQTQAGSFWRAGAFIDYELFHLFMTYQQDIITLSVSGQNKRPALLGGLRFHF